MTLQTSGVISLTDVQTEFGGSNPVGLAEYYRGGTLVPSGTTAGTGSSQTTPLTPAAPAQISTAGTIQLSQFYGTTAFNPVAPSGSLVANSSVATGGSPSKSVTGQTTWGPDGTTHTFTNNGAGGITILHANWYTPTTTDIGHTYYALTDIQAESEEQNGSDVPVSGSNVSGLRTTWGLIEFTAGSGSGVTLSLNVNSTGPNEIGRSAHGHLYISPNASGTPIIATWDWSINVLISN